MKTHGDRDQIPFSIPKRRYLPWERFILLSLLVVLVVPFLGLFKFGLTPFSGAIVGYLMTRNHPQRTAVFCWIPSFVLFAWAAWDPISKWDRVSSGMSHWQYFSNTMFGPDCSSSECLYTLFTSVLAGGLGYSLAAYFVLLQARRRAALTTTETVE